MLATLAVVGAATAAAVTTAAMRGGGESGSSHSHGEANEDGKQGHDDLATGDHGSNDGSGEERPRGETASAEPSAQGDSAPAQKAPPSKGKPGGHPHRAGEADHDKPVVNPPAHKKDGPGH